MVMPEVIDLGGNGRGVGFAGAVFENAVGIDVTRYGVNGDGVYNNTALIDKLLETGENLIFPPNGTYLTDGEHVIRHDGQTITNYGCIKHTGRKREIRSFPRNYGDSDYISGGFGNGYNAIFIVPDYIDRFALVGSGYLDGARYSFIHGDAGCGVFAVRAPNVYIDHHFRKFINCAVKLVNCPNSIVTKRSTFIDIHNIGTELKSYLNDFRTGVPWVGIVLPQSGDIDGYYEKINDFQLSSANGCGIDFSAADGSLPMRNLRISGRFYKCWIGIWSENNFAGSEAFNIVIDQPQVYGDPTGADQTMNGIGLIGLRNFVVNMPVVYNVSNTAPAVGSQSASLTLVDCKHGNINMPVLRDDRATTPRTEYGMRVSACDDLNILYSKISGHSISDYVSINGSTNITKVP